MKYVAVVIVLVLMGLASIGAFVLQNRVNQIQDKPPAQAKEGVRN